METLESMVSRSKFLALRDMDWPETEDWTFEGVVLVDRNGNGFRLDGLTELPAFECYSSRNALAEVGSTAEEQKPDYSCHPSLQRYLQRDRCHSAEIGWGLRFRAWDRSHMQFDGHHFGGNHHWKNRRQSPSLRGVDDGLYAAEQFGLPQHVLVSTVQAFSFLQEQQSIQAWCQQVSASYGGKRLGHR